MTTQRPNDVPARGRAEPPPMPVPPAGPGGPAPVGSPLADADYRMIRQAAGSRRAVRRAARVARANAVIELGIGILALCWTVFSWSWTSLLVALALTAVGIVEFIGHDRLRRAEPSAARLLALNQIALFAVITIYCVAQMLAFSGGGAGQPVVPDDVRAQLRDVLGDFPLTALVVGFYALIIALSLAFQGGMSLYYFTRRRHIETFRRETPEWVRRLLVALDA